jgi:hypothetical protein
MRLEQSDVQAEFVSASNGSWTEVYRQSYEHQNHNLGIYCALAPADYRERALNSSSWDLTITDGAPGFATYYDQDKETTVYHRQVSDDGVEPLVLVREFHGVRPSFVEIIEEFRLFHNLYWDERSSSFVRFGGDGAEQLAVELGVDRVRIRTKLLRQYQAARQLDLLLFIDSVRWSEPGSAHDIPPYVDWSADNSRLERFPGDSMGGERSFTRLFGKIVVPAPPIEKSGVWPYEERDEHFPSFIIGVNTDGDNIEYTCNDDLLSNNFETNPNAPHYLTPVHFRREVLRKYYDNPDLYTVEDGYLRCAGLWGVQIDNDHDDRVIVFLGDLGRDLPEGERDYWRSFNIPPDKKMSETAIRRSFLAEFADPKAADLKFRHAYSRFLHEWEDSRGWSLFREPVGSDAYILQQIRLPLTDSDSEFDETVGRLAKLLCDGIDSAAIQAQLGTKVADEKSIAKLNRWLDAAGYPHRDRDIKYLRDLQELRSAVSAHAKGSGYEKVLTKIFGGSRGRAAIVQLLERAQLMLDALREWATSDSDLSPGGT